MVKQNLQKKNTDNDNYIILDDLNLGHSANFIDENNLPKVSFCIPTLNNDDTIDECLQSIVSQDYPEIEIIIVDGRSKDNTIEICKKYTDHIFYDEGMLGSARQTGVDNSSGEILALFDSDIVIPHNKWLLNAVKCFNLDYNISTVWPVNIAPPNGGLTVRLYFNHWKVIMDNRIKNNIGLVGGGNALFSKKAIEDIGGINRNLHWGEDFDWARKLKNKEYKVVFLKDPLYHDTMRSFKRYAKKQFVGAKTFTTTGFGLMNLSFWDVINEQIILGTKGMLKGLFFQRDVSWLLFPPYISVRIIAYIHTYFNNFVRT